MTVSSELNKNNYTGTGSQTVFPYKFVIYSETHMKVYLNDILQSSGYTVDGVNNPSGGNVTFSVAPVQDVRVTLLREVPQNQEADYTAFDRFPAEQHEVALDLAAMGRQQLNEQNTRQVQLPVSDPGGNTLPTRLNQQNKFLALDGATPYPNWIFRTGTEDLSSLPWIYAPEAGAIADGVTDDSVVLQGMIDQLEAAGGGRLLLGPKSYGIGSTLYVDRGNVLIVGEGRGGNMNNIALNRSTASTRLIWVGGATGPMLHFTSSRTNTPGYTTQAGGGIYEVQLDGMATCTKGLHVSSWQDLLVHIQTIHFTSIHWHLDVLTAANTAGSPRSIRRSKFNIIATDIDTTNEASVLGVINGGNNIDGIGDIHNCLFEDIVCRVNQSAVALEIGDSDNCIFLNLDCDTRLTPTGDGGKVFLHADDTVTFSPQAGVARYHNFIQCQTVKGLVAKATVAGSVSSFGNVVQNYSRANNQVEPTIENGAMLKWGDNSPAGNQQSRPGGEMGKRLRGVLLKLDATLGTTSSIGVEIPWGSAEYDTESAWVSGTNVTVPQGVYACRISVQIDWQGVSGGSRVMNSRKNGSATIDMPAFRFDVLAAGATQNWLNSSGKVEVSPGDVLTVYVIQDSGSPVNIQTGRTFFCCEWL